MPKYKVRVIITEETIVETVDAHNKMAAIGAALLNIQENLTERLEFQILAEEVHPWDM